MRTALFLLLTVLLSACAENPIPDPLTVDTGTLDEGAFTAELTGVVNEQLEGTAELILDPGYGYGLYLRSERYSVNFVLPLDVIVGTHIVVPAMSISPQRIQAVRGMVTDSEVVAESLLPVYLYANVIQGRLTLTSVDPMTGAFELTVADDAGGTIMARGTFNAVPPVPAEE